MKIPKLLSLPALSIAFIAAVDAQTKDKKPAPGPSIVFKKNGDPLCEKDGRSFRIFNVKTGVFGEFVRDGKGLTIQGQSFNVVTNPVMLLWMAPENIDPNGPENFIKSARAFCESNVLPEGIKQVGTHKPAVVLQNLQKPTF